MRECVRCFPVESICSMMSYTLLVHIHNVLFRHKRLSSWYEYSQINQCSSKPFVNLFLEQRKKYIPMSNGLVLVFQTVMQIGERSTAGHYRICFYTLQHKKAVVSIFMWCRAEIHNSPWHPRNRRMCSGYYWFCKCVMCTYATSTLPKRFPSCFILMGWTYV